MHVAGYSTSEESAAKSGLYHPTLAIVTASAGSNRIHAHTSLLESVCKESHQQPKPQGFD